MAGDATVEESAMLRQQTTGEDREVDVVLRSKVGSHEVVVSIEARASARKADLPWVESMLGKHADLPTSKLVLVSEAGFTRPAARLAEAKGAIAVSPRDLAGDHPGRALIHQLRSVQAQEVRLELKQMILSARRPSGESIRSLVPLNTNAYAADGRYLTMLNLLFEAERAANLTKFSEATPDTSGSLEVQLLPPWNLPDGSSANDLFARWEEKGPAEMHRIEEVAVLTDIAVDDVPTIEMTVRQLGDIAYAYGEATIAGEQALIVATADGAGGQITIRPRRA